MRYQETKRKTVPDFGNVGRRREQRSGAGLFVSLIFASYGLDLSPGFFRSSFRLRRARLVLLEALERALPKQSF
jgi:hypothetical protein